MKEKRCHQCGETKPFKEFDRDLRSCDGREDWCKVCSFDHYLAQSKRRLARTQNLYNYSPSSYRKLKYGINQETYDQVYERQDGKCAICGVREQLVVDHDHHLEKYGPIAFRGLLCAQCNAGLGMFKDNPRLLRSAIKYLQAFRVY